MTDSVHPMLERSYKGRFPFRIGTTSFIYRDDYLPNVRRLGPYLDEIELLLFESSYHGALPSAATVAKLSAVGRDLDLTYNIHLPTDVFLGHEDPAVRRAGIGTLARVIDLTLPLAPTTLTLHLLPALDAGFCGDLTPWQDRLRASLEKLIADTGIDPRRISAETLNYPFEWVQGVVADLDLAVCLDLGHLLVHGYDMQGLFDRHGGRTAILHLHGVAGGADHLALSRMAATDLAVVSEILRSFDGTVSLEVFNFEDLALSLGALETCLSTEGELP